MVKTRISIPDNYQISLSGVQEKTVSSKEKLILLYINNKSSDQLVHPCSLIRVLYIHVKYNSKTWNISIFYLVYVAEQAGLSLTWSHNLKTGPEVIKLFSCSTQLSIKFQLLIKTKMLNRYFLLLSSHIDVFILLINVKMPTIAGIFTFMSMINFALSWVEQKKVL